MAIPSEKGELLASQEKLCILLVDDEGNIREALSEYLSAINNHEVITASTGREALEVFEPNRFDCAFLDLKMPGMDGVQAFTKAGRMWIRPCRWSS